MDIQAAEIEPPGATPRDYGVPFKAFPDPASIEGAADVLLSAERPVLLVGGGVIIAHAEETLRELAEYVGMPVITTLTSKGVISEEHPLNAFYTGPKGSTCGVNVVRAADVFLAVGFRFSEWASGSYRPGEVFSIPPQRVIQIDIDPAEIGRNYPVVAPVLADAGPALRSLLDAVKRRTPRREYEATPAYRDLQAWRGEWLDRVTNQTARDAQPMTMSRALAEIRKALPRDAIVVTSSGHSQGIVYQEFPIYEPRTHISAGGFSTMGWSFPAALGIKSALPGRVVATLIGDGDFLMTCQELATAMQYGIPVLNCVLNNSGYLSIRDMQASIFGQDRTIATESTLPDGTPYSPDLAALAQSFGAYGARVDDTDALAEAVRAALSSGRPAVLDIRVATAYPDSGNELGAWAEFPQPSLVGAG
jgi:acetolactate synthase-1/2/3 large subunit